MVHISKELLIGPKGKTHVFILQNSSHRILNFNLFAIRAIWSDTKYWFINHDLQTYDACRSPVWAEAMPGRGTWSRVCVLVRAASCLCLLHSITCPTMPHCLNHTHTLLLTSCRLFDPINYSVKLWVWIYRCNAYHEKLTQSMFLSGIHYFKSTYASY